MGIPVALGLALVWFWLRSIAPMALLLQPGETYRFAVSAPTSPTSPTGQDAVGQFLVSQFALVPTALGGDANDAHLWRGTARYTGQSPMSAADTTDLVWVSIASAT
jgi:hypothetical protein